MNLGSFALAAVAASFGLFQPAWAHGDGKHPAQPRMFDAGRVEATPFGQEGDPARVVRTVRVDMSDAMRFAPAAITVRRGQTVRIVAANKGRLLHEIVFGTPDELREHAEQMKKFPEMEHSQAYMAHVKPGASGEIVWRFTKAGTFQFACLMPGHFDAGMIGTVTVR